MRPQRSLSEFDLEAFELAAGAGEVPRRVRAFGGDLEGFALRRGAADGERRAQESEADSLEEIHLCSLIFERLGRRPGVEPGGRLGPLRYSVTDKARENARATGAACFPTLDPA